MYDDTRSLFSKSLKISGGVGGVITPRPPISNILFWEVASDIVGFADGANIPNGYLWLDRTIHHNNLLDVGGGALTLPVYHANVDGSPAVEFPYSGGLAKGTAFQFPVGMGTPLTELAIFAKFKRFNDPPTEAAQSALWDFNPAAAIPATQTLVNWFADRHIYESSGSSARKDAGIPPVNLAASFVTYGVTSKNGEFKVYVNGAVIFTTAVNTFSVRGNCRVGTSVDVWFSGYAKAWLGYSVVPNAAGINQIFTYLNTV